jgi:hypothetical protein
MLRDIEKHLCQLHLLEKSSDLSKQYGIKSKSVLLNLHDFDICQCLLHDPMHVIVEGICINELKYLLIYLTKTKKIDLNIINKKIMDFEYFFIDKDDKPNSINENHIANGSFPLSAGQMMTLVINMPFIIGDLFGQYDQNWLNFINLNQILNLVFSFFYDCLTLKHLDLKIYEYLQNFHDLYPDASMTPKLHYLTHLVAQMVNIGPLRHHARFRFEAKNFLIKNFDYKCFKNICFSATDKHQFWMASKELEQLNKKSMKYVDDVCNVDQNKTIDPCVLAKFNFKSSISVCKFLKKDGFKYIPGCFLIIELDLSVDMTSVGLVKEIFVVDGNHIFYLQLFKIVKQNSSLNCFEISLTTKHHYIKFDDLIFKQAQFGIYVSNKLYLQVRYYHHLLIPVS